MLPKVAEKDEIEDPTDALWDMFRNMMTSAFKVNRTTS